MSEAVLEGKVRKVGRKGPSRRLRAEGFLPGMIYGQGDNVPVTVEAKAIKKILEVKGGRNNILKTKLKGDSKERTVMIKSLDVHPIYDTLLHIDLIEIDVKKRIKVSVPLEFIGVSKGVKLSGGLMNINLRVLKVECLATDIPPFIEVHIDDLDIGDMLRVKELKIDAAVTILSDLETMIVSVTEPKAEVEPEVVEAVEGEEVAEGEEAEKPKEGAADSKEPAEPESK